MNTWLATAGDNPTSIEKYRRAKKAAAALK
jgi:hypothetical protein